MDSQAHERAESTTAAPDQSADASGVDSDVLPEGTPSKRRSRALRTAAEWAILIAAALLIAFLVKTFLFQAFWIPSDSMVPTLQKNDRVLVNKISYRLHDVNRGDIVVFTAPEAAQSDIKDLVKRVIALEGETVEGRDGSIYIDGKLLEEPYLPSGTTSRIFAPVEVPEDSLFMLGDNRLGSRDSTSFGPIPQSDLVGRVFVRIWPPSRVGFL